MPFLRRRGVMASESDMRRHTVVNANTPLPEAFPNASKLMQQQQQQLELEKQQRQQMQERERDRDWYRDREQQEQGEGGEQEQQPQQRQAAAAAAAAVAVAVAVVEKPRSAKPFSQLPADPPPPPPPSEPPVQNHHQQKKQKQQLVATAAPISAQVRVPGPVSTVVFAPRATPPTEKENQNPRQPASALISTSNSTSTSTGGQATAVPVATAVPTAAPVPQIPTIELPARARSPPIHDESSKQRRFSMLRFRNASDSQLSARAKQQALAAEKPPLPKPPEIITTAPTMDLNLNPKKHNRLRLPFGIREPREEATGSASGSVHPPISMSKKDRRKTIIGPNPSSTSSISNGKPSISFEEPTRPEQSGHGHGHGQQPPAYGDESESNGLPLPFNRLSESSRSDGSSGDRVYGSTTTTTHTVHTTTTFFRLPRRRHKQPAPLFPIAHLQKANSQAPPTGGASATSLSSMPHHDDPARAATPNTPTPSRPASSRRGGGGLPGAGGPIPSVPSVPVLNKPAVSPATALFRPNSRNSGQSSPTRGPLNLRGRSSTMSSLGRDSMDDRLAPPTTRTSTSTGRKSFGDLLGLNKLRQNSDMSGRHGTLTPATPASSASKNNSIQLARDSVILPERREDDTPVKYLARLEAVVSRSVIASALSKSADPFSQAVLRSYMRGFSFFGDPMDMSIRKLLMEAELPKETQQIDRCLQAFANRYHECNPGIYTGPDQAYFIAFSLLILHTDVFNKNNKHKMQKPDYLKNTRGEGVFDDILECFYDNITYTPFIHVEDDLDINGERIVAHKAKKKPSLFLGVGGNADPVKRATKEPIDPYTLIIDNKLDILRPNLKDVMHLDDSYSYLGTAKSLNLQELQKTFFKTGVLQIVSARSRPDAFMTEKTATNPEEAHPGIVDIKITKVGLLWRKDVKKKKTRSPWQEWGAILTGAQLYFFRNTNWIKSLMHQLETHIRHGHDGIPVIFQPPLEHFKPDALMSTDGAVALLDSSYRKHKNAFVYVRHGGSEEVLLADNEEELNDWLAKLNYAAAFRTSGVRMRGVVGAGYDGQGRRAIRRLESGSSQSSQSVVQTPTGEVTIARSRIDPKMAQDILDARRQIMFQRVAEADKRLQAEEAKLEDHLTNARHLQIMSPIQPKTRDAILLAAARMAAQLKWTRMEIWRLKCHRDILLMDLEEERQLLGLPPNPADNTTSPLGREDSKASSSTAVVAAAQQSPKSAIHVSPSQPSVGSGGLIPTAGPEDVSTPETDEFKTPPTSAGPQAHHHRHHNSWDLPGLGFDRVSLRKASVSSAVSSASRSHGASPSRKLTSSGSVPTVASVAAVTTPVAEQAVAAAAQQQPTDKQSDEVDATERALLERAGLIDATTTSADGIASPAATAVDNGGDAADSRERRGSQQQQQADGKQDRSKIRRSLQRTLREGAGHLSHRGSRKSKDITSPAMAQVTSNGSHSHSHTHGHGHHHHHHNNIDDELSRDGSGGSPTTDVLSRGSGSFVVHGKKASVINFGGDLQGILSPELGRSRKTLQTPQQQTHSTPHQGHQGGGGPPSPHGVSFGGIGIGGAGEDSSDVTTITTSDGSAQQQQQIADFRAALQSPRDVERRESAASASTATARSFRELHRKYSSAQAAAAAAVVASRSGGNLSLPDGGDVDSDAAVSFSEGRRTPLPPIEHDSDEEESNGNNGHGNNGNGGSRFVKGKMPMMPAGREDEEDDEDDDASSISSVTRSVVEDEEEEDDDDDAGAEDSTKDNDDEFLSPTGTGSSLPGSSPPHTRFYTPEPRGPSSPSSPTTAATQQQRLRSSSSAEVTREEEEDQQREDNDEMEKEKPVVVSSADQQGGSSSSPALSQPQKQQQQPQLSSPPPIQIVSA